MTLPFLTRPYERWAPVVGRVLFGLLFLNGAFWKIPGTDMFAMQVAGAEAVGIPFATVAVTLAFILELVAGIMLVVGWNTRLAAFALILFVILIAAFYGRNLADMQQMTTFFTCLQIIAGLLYVSTYGAQRAAIATCPLPDGLTKSV